MKLPEKTIIAPAKLKEYLLSQRKRNDKSKWLAKAGYRSEEWQKLERDLRSQILPIDAIPTDRTRYGQAFEIKGTLIGPNGTSLRVRTIWIKENESKSVKFITMFPEK